MGCRPELYGDDEVNLADLVTRDIPAVEPAAPRNRRALLDR